MQKNEASFFLTKCPECTKDVSEMAPACPHCGFALKTTPQAIPDVQPLKRKAAIFQYVSLGAIVVAFFTPRLLVSIPCLVIISTAIIALVRVEPRWWLSLASVFMGILLIGAGTSNLPSPDTSYVSKMEIQDRDLTFNHPYMYMRGRVKNIGDKTVSYFKITAYYNDVKGNVLDTDYTNNAEDLRPGMSKEFEIMHRVSSDYADVSLVVDEARTR
jgi:hypothetical protein